MLSFTACQSKTKASNQNSGVISENNRNVEQLSEAIEVILNDATVDFIGNYPISEDFFYWVASN